VHLDLHLHTSCSDGALTPEELAHAAKRAGLHLIAVTDHDTTVGVDRARGAAAGLGLTVLAGVELSCNLEGEDLHLLGYGVDPRNLSLADLTSSVSAARLERIVEIVRRLQRLGVPISVEDVRTGEECAAAGRPHVAEALVRLGVVRTPQEAFDRFLADRGPAHVPSGGPDVAKGIAAVHEAGGVSVWAHPAPQDARRFATLAEIGLQGVEALRPALQPAESLAIEHAARAAGMVVSGGSDWHGGSRRALGSWYVTERHVGQLLERLGLSAA
jgi:hypothetical protein